MRLSWIFGANAVAAFLNPGMLLHQQRLEAEMSAPKMLGHVRMPLNVSAPYGPVAAERYTVPLDHFSGDNGSFSIRYWVQESDYQEGGPVFVYDVGEGDAESGVRYRLQNETSFFKQLVKEFHGMGIVIEHRYYGKSVPFNITVNTPSEKFKWLTTEQALADFPVLANNFSRPNWTHVDLTPRSTPWIFVGGSYSGMRAAFMRKTYPDVVFASYASSAPVEARVDMSVYFQQIYRGMVRYGYSNCTMDVHAAVSKIDSQLRDNVTAAAVKRKFLGPGAEANSNEGFADALSVIFYNFQSYGLDGPPGSLREFCDYIGTDPKTNRTSPAEGWAALRGSQYVVDRWASWPYFNELVNDNMPTDCLGPSPKTNMTMFLPDGTRFGPLSNATQNANNTVSCKLDEKTHDPGSISWAWQYCSQWGYFQSTNVGPTSLISRLNTPEHQAALCHRQFSLPNATDTLPRLPLVDRANQRFGGWDMQVSNVFWTAGEFDPWRTLGVFSEERFAPKDFKHFTAAPQCGAFPERHEFFGFLLPDAQHCYDFRTTFPAGQTARGLFSTALTRWLGCHRQDRRMKMKSKLVQLKETSKLEEPKVEEPKLAVKQVEPAVTQVKPTPLEKLTRRRRGRFVHAIDNSN